MIIQACEAQEKYRNAAQELVKELDSFLSVEKDIPMLKEKPVPRKAVGCMLGLIAEIASYIKEHTPAGYLGATEAGFFNSHLSTN